jgi:hypothetical protein
VPGARSVSLEPGDAPGSRLAGTHPIPQKYLLTHERCGTWAGQEWSELLAPTMTDEPTRLAYD